MSEKIYYNLWSCIYGVLGEGLDSKLQFKIREEEGIYSIMYGMSVVIQIYAARVKNPAKLL